jgi:hypothetical protein
MENIVFDDKTEKEPTEEELLDEDSISAEEEAFMRGYSDEEEEIVCAECGVAIRGKSLTKEIDGETHRFCSDDCVKEFEEGMG